MKRVFKSFLAVFGAIVLLAASGPAVADIFVFPSPPDRNSLGNLSGVYRDFSIFSMNTLAVAGYLNAVKLPSAPYVEYTPANNTQPGWVNPGYDWPGGQHTYVIKLPSPTGGQPAAIPGLHPITGLPGELVPGGTSGLLVLYNSSITLPNTAEGFLAPDFLAKVDAIVAFTPAVSTTIIYEKVPEPGTLLLLGGGLIGLGVIRRRFRS